MDLFFETEDSVWPAGVPTSPELSVEYLAKNIALWVAYKEFVVDDIIYKRSARTNTANWFLGIKDGREDLQGGPSFVWFANRHADLKSWLKRETSFVPSIRTLKGPPPFE